MFTYRSRRPTCTIHEFLNHGELRTLAAADPLPAEQDPLFFTTDSGHHLIAARGIGHAFTVDSGSAEAVAQVMVERVRDLPEPHTRPTAAIDPQMSIFIRMFDADEIFGGRILSTMPLGTALPDAGNTIYLASVTADTVRELEVVRRAWVWDNAGHLTVHVLVVDFGDEKPEPAWPKGGAWDQAVEQIFPDRFYDGP